MIRIGYDPILEAERQHKELLKQAEHERMLRQVRETSPSRMRASSRILALIGREMASVGLRLTERYGEGSEAYLDIISQTDLKSCN